jgi:alpha-1,3-glucosyltransferase
MAAIDSKDSIAASPIMANLQPTPASCVWFGWDVLPSEWDVLLLSTALKLLLFPA